MSIASRHCRMLDIQAAMTEFMTEMSAAGRVVTEADVARFKETMLRKRQERDTQGQL